MRRGIVILTNVVADAECERRAFEGGDVADRFFAPFALSDSIRLVGDGARRDSAGHSI